MPDMRSGIIEMPLGSWRDFPAFMIREDVLRFSHEAVWRGQSSASWPLETSFDRAVRRAGDQPTEQLARLHLERFKRATRGRRITAYRPSLSDDDWWTLGQHYGLVTPMLDWTYSPYVALYFAFLDHECADPAERRAVWAVNLKNLHTLNARVAAAPPPGAGEHGLRTLDPMVDENARLVNQNGVFTRGPVGTTVDAWVRQALGGEAQAILVKVLIPGHDRDDCLRYLNKMNINHATLFPDLDGASRHCNHQLTISGY